MATTQRVNSEELRPLVTQALTDEEKRLLEEIAAAAKGKVGGRRHKRYRGGEGEWEIPGTTCGKYHFVIYKSIALTVVTGFIALAAKTAVDTAGDAGAAAAAAVSDRIDLTCDVKPSEMNWFQLGICGSTTSIMAHMSAALADNNLSTMRAALTGAGALAAFQTLKNGATETISKVNALANVLVKDFCEKYHSLAKTASASTQTDSAASVAAELNSGTLGVPAGQKPITHYFTRSQTPKAGRRRRTMKKRKGMKRSTRKMSFRY